MSHRLRSTSAILVAFAAPLGIYVASLRGDVSTWDTGDLQTVPYILGIPYPTGFPGYVLLGWVWSHVLVAGNVAWRLNLLGAVASAGTAAALAALLITLGAAAAIAAGAAVAYALAYVAWSHATYIDAHPFAFCAVAWSLVYAVRWSRSGGVSDALACTGTAAIALACDNSTALALCGITLVALSRRPPLRAGLAVLGIAGAAVIAVYAYLPLRSAAVTAAQADPTLALGIPPGRPFWDDGHPATWDGFVRVVTGSTFAPQRALLGMTGPGAMRTVTATFAPQAATDFGGLFPWIALFGGVILWWRRPLVLGGVVLLGVLPLLFVSAYDVEAEPTRYYLPAYFAIAAGAGYGAAALDAGLHGVQRTAALAVLGCAWCVLVYGDVVAGGALFEQPAEHAAHDWIERVAARTPPHAIVVVGWNDATPLAYGRYVLHALGDRIIVTAGAQQYAGRYRAWLRTRPVVVVAGERPALATYTLHELDAGDPHLYALR